MHSIFRRRLLGAAVGGVSGIALGGLVALLAPDWSPAGVLLAVLVAVFMGDRLAARPLANCLASVEQIATSRDFRERQADDIEPAAPGADCLSGLRQLCRQHTRLLHEVVDGGTSMARAAAEVAHAAGQITARVHAQADGMARIAGAAEAISGNVETSVSNTSLTVETAKSTRRVSYEGRELVQQTARCMAEVKGQVQAAADEIVALESQAGQIEQVSSVISGIAEQTNLLALNAAIEAARAGEQGRGFAVVADEVRNLARRTSQATEEIGRTVGQIAAETERAAATMRGLVAAVESTSSQTLRVDRQFEEILEFARQVEQQVVEIAQGGEHNLQQLQEISGSIQALGVHVSETEADLTGVTGQAQELSERAEALYAAIGEAQVGSIHDRMRKLANDTALAVQDAFEQALSDGRLSEQDLFDRDYQPIPDTEPQKYRTRFDAFTDEVLPGLQEPLLSAHPEIAFAAAVDDKGYLPTHNAKFARPLTGDYQRDLVANRTKRIYTDRTGQRCGSNTQPFLLQTYKRDTGEVMHDMSAPIQVRGRHWGGFRIGYQAD